MSSSSQKQQQPAAPYPPMMMKNSIQNRNASPSFAVSADPSQQQQQQQQLNSSAPLSEAVYERSRSTSIGAAPPSQQSQQPQQPQRYAPQVKFWGSFEDEFANANIYGSINCRLDHYYSSAAVRSLGEGRISRQSKKQGPVLLEIRRLALTKQSPTLYDNLEGDADHYDDNFKDDSLKNATEPLFHSEVLAVSRGNPSLGASMASTCISFAPSSGSGNSIKCATGLTSGALSVHTISESVSELLDEGATSASTSISYFQGRHHRPASAVAWSPRETRHVAIGLLLGGSGSSQSSSQTQTSQGSTGGGIPSGRMAAGAERGGGISGTSSSDREFCCLVWDMEHQSSRQPGLVGAPAGSTKGLNVKTPVFRLARGSGVASLGWLSDGQTLAVGSQLRNLQLYDLRMSGMNTPPVSVYAHSRSVHGIEVDPHRPHIFATFGRFAVGEPVKLWDIRRMDSCMSEIKTNSFLNHQMGPATDPTSDAAGAGGTLSPIGWGGSTQSRISLPNSPGTAVVTDLAWSNQDPGTLSVAAGDTIRNFDTTAAGSRPLLTRINYCPGPVSSLAFHPPSRQSSSPPTMRTSSIVSRSQTTTQSRTDTASSEEKDETSAMAKRENLDEKRAIQLTHKSSRQHVSNLYPHRILLAMQDGSLHDMAKFQLAPMIVSRRDGRVVHSLGSTIWTGSAAFGPTAMENTMGSDEEDISATMKRRARCIDGARYSMDVATNTRLLLKEESTFRQVRGGDDSKRTVSSKNRSELLRLWGWVERVELLNTAGKDTSVILEDALVWPAKGLVDAGVSRLLRMDLPESDDYVMGDTTHFSDSLRCDTYTSHARRAALSSVGWVSKFGLRDVSANCEAQGHFERSAALAVWHGDLGAGVAALQRGADAIRLKLEDAGDQLASSGNDLVTMQYAETLQLVAMCIAGYSGNATNPNSTSTNIWRNACEGLLRRQDVSRENVHLDHIPYLRAVCSFLVNIGQDGGLDKILYDETLSLCDRVGFACCFLSRSDLRIYLKNCVLDCLSIGNIEGLIITGLSKQGIKLLHSYVDHFSDVQTATLISSRLILPSDWTPERVICSEWLDSYRDLLNTWQMWQSRAMFDVGRSELFRQLRTKQAEDMAGNANVSGMPGGRGTVVAQHPGRRWQQGKKQSGYYPAAVSSAKLLDSSTSLSALPSIPAQLYARCNYCNTSLPLSKLRRQEGIANNWLSRQKPVLSCCPQCRKPLPRCAICLLPLGCLNPYMELKRERTSAAALRNSAGATHGDDLSELSNLPFAEWFTWCMRCKHGGHAHHLVGWFANHDTCAVSGCDCPCQFDSK